MWPGALGEGRKDGQHSTFTQSDEGGRARGCYGISKSSPFLHLVMPTPGALLWPALLPAHESASPAAFRTNTQRSSSSGAVTHPSRSFAACSPELMWTRFSSDARRLASTFYVAGKIKSLQPSGGRVQTLRTISRQGVLLTGPLASAPAEPALEHAPPRPQLPSRI